MARDQLTAFAHECGLGRPEAALLLLDVSKRSATLTAIASLATERRLFESARALIPD